MHKNVADIQQQEEQEWDGEVLGVVFHTVALHTITGGIEEDGVAGITIKDKVRNAEQDGEIDGYVSMIKIKDRKKLKRGFVNTKNSKIIIILIKK